MHVVIVTDAWRPQVNGVVKTLGKTCEHLIEMGYQVTMITPQEFKTFPCPSYPGIRLSLLPYRKMARRLHDISPDAIHIATEGPLGLAARRWCRRQKFQFTTSYHTQFPEYLRLRLPIPLSVSYAWLRRFHRPAVNTLVPTASQQQRLNERGFTNVYVWGRGVDTEIFRPEKPHNYNLPKPIFVNMGRVAVEKNIEAFLDLDLPGSKVVIGDGPDLAMLRRQYPGVTFTGAKFGDELASYLAGTDVFVFPSKTDTFGLVILEAMACGLPVAAYPVTGPADIIQNGQTGIVADNLRVASLQALDLNHESCVRYAQQHSWTACTREFAHFLINNHSPTDEKLSSLSEAGQ